MMEQKARQAQGTAQDRAVIVAYEKEAGTAPENGIVNAPEDVALEAPARRRRLHFKFGISSLYLSVSVALLLSACGYHVGGMASRLPPGLKTIAVPALKNDTNRYRIEQRMTEAVVREFLARTKYRIVASEDSADAVLHGEITSFDAIPVVFDTTPAPNSTTVPAVNATTARGTTTLISVHMKVWLEERETKNVLYKNDNYLFREPYELSTDPSKFFDEQGPALDRMSRDFAARLVSDILENF
jgi:outer membrane lipopolysaccharide assembly protein LptE/RlpB